MCYSSSKDFGWGVSKEVDRQPEAGQEAPEATPMPGTAQDFTFRAFPQWRRVQAPLIPAAKKTRAGV